MLVNKCLEYVITNEKFITKIPESLASELAAPLLCGEYQEPQHIGNVSRLMIL